MNRLAQLLMLALIIGVALAGKRKVSDLDRLIIKDKVTELHWFYNTNMDSAAALGGVRPSTDPEYKRRLSNIVNTFCPDPIFNGWTARGGADGAVNLSARRRNAASPGQSTFAVDTVYGFLTGGPAPTFLNSSQHFVGMPIIDVYYDDDHVLHADVNATLAQWVNLSDPSVPTGGTLAAGHYFNKFILHDPPGEGDDNAFWCMQEFNALNTFGMTLAKQADGTYKLAFSAQLAADKYLSAFVRPGSAGDN